MIGSRSIIDNIYLIKYDGNLGLELINESPFLPNIRTKGRKKRIKITSNIKLTPITILSNNKYENNFLILKCSKSYKYTCNYERYLVYNNESYRSELIYENSSYSYKMEEIDKNKFVISFGDNYELKFLVNLVNYGKFKKRLEIEDIKYKYADNFMELINLLILSMWSYPIFNSIFKEHYEPYEIDCKDLNEVLDIVKKESDKYGFRYKISNIGLSDDLIYADMDIYIETKYVSFGINFCLGIYKSKYIIIAPVTELMGTLVFKLGGSKLWFIRYKNSELYSDGNDLYLGRLLLKIDGEDLKVEKMDDYVVYYKLGNSTEFYYSINENTYLIGANYFDIPLNLLLVNFNIDEYFYINTIIYSYLLRKYHYLYNEFKVVFDSYEQGVKPMFNYVTTSLTQKLEYSQQHDHKNTHKSKQMKLTDFYI